MNTTTIVNRQFRTKLNTANVVLGLWLIASPFALGLAHTTGAIWNNVCVGIVVTLLGLGVSTSGAARSFSVLLGAWEIASPFVLGYQSPRFYWNNIILGCLIVIFTVLTLSIRTSNVAQPHPQP